MTPHKRRVRPGDVEHQGRVTVPRGSVPLPLPTRPSTTSARRRTGAEPAAPEASNRYTPPIKSVRFRPGWHKALGAGLVVIGAAVAVLNDVMLLQQVTLLPGGHNEFYLILGLCVVGYSTWWFGWFDRER